MRIARRRTGAAVGVLVAAALAATGCGSSSGSTATGGSGNDKVTLNVGLFGTFGFKEAGLYDQYQKLHPNVTVKETSVEQEQNYYQALQTHLAGGSGLADVQGIEVGRIADVVSNQSGKWVDLNTLGANDVKSTFYDWKWAAATSKDGKTLGLGTDTGPEAMCYRTDLFKQAGLPTDPAAVAKLWPSWQAFLDLGKRYQAKAPARSAFHDSASGLYNIIIGQSKTVYYDEGGNLIYGTNPAVKQAWDLSMAAVANKETARLKQFDKEWNAGFANGAFATVACPAWMLGYIKGQAGDAYAGKWSIAAAPGGTGNWGGSYLGVPKASKHQKEAYDFVKWITAPEQQVAMWTKGGHFPSSSTAAANSAVESAKDPYFSNAPIGETFKASADKAPVATIGPKDGTIKDTISNGILAVEQQGKAPDQAWQDTLKAIRSAIGG